MDHKALLSLQVLKHETDMPTPESFLEQVVDNIVKQIEDSATTGFRAALAEAIQYHRFILAAQNTRDDAGNAFNLAEVGGFFPAPIKIGFGNIGGLLVRPPIKWALIGILWTA